MNVFAWRSTPIQASELPALVYRDRTEKHEMGWGISENIMPVEIEIYGTTIAQIREAIAELERDIYADPTWGGLAIDTSLDSSEMEIEQKENIFCASQIIMTVYYRTVIGDPDTQG